MTWSRGRCPARLRLLRLEDGSRPSGCGVAGDSLHGALASAPAVFRGHGHSVHRFWREAAAVAGLGGRSNRSSVRGHVASTAATSTKPLRSSGRRGKMLRSWSLAVGNTDFVVRINNENHRVPKWSYCSWKMNFGRLIRRGKKTFPFPRFSRNSVDTSVGLRLVFGRVGFV